MTAGWDIIQWIPIGANIAGTVLNSLLWTVGCVIVSRSRPAPGARFLAIGFGLLAFLSFTSSLHFLRFVLLNADIVDESDFLMNAPLFYLGYSLLSTGLMVTAAALIVIGATRALRFSERF